MDSLRCSEPTLVCSNDVSQLPVCVNLVHTASQASRTSRYRGCLPPAIQYFLALSLVLYNFLAPYLAQNRIRFCMQSMLNSEYESSCPVERRRPSIDRVRTWPVTSALLRTVTLFIGRRRRCLRRGSYWQSRWRNLDVRRAHGAQLDVRTVCLRRLLRSVLLRFLATGSWFSFDHDGLWAFGAGWRRV